MEKKLQIDIKKYLKSKGCDVLVITPQPGIPNGWEDITFFKESFWGTIEVKASKNAKFQPFQSERIKKHNNWSWARAVHPDNWDDIKKELDVIL